MLRLRWRNICTSFLSSFLSLLHFFFCSLCQILFFFHLCTFRQLTLISLDFNFFRARVRLGLLDWRGWMTLNERVNNQPSAVATVAVVPMLSGTTFCYQTQSLKLDPSIIGISKVIGQLLVLSATIVYNRCLKRIPMRKLIYWVQIMYAVSMLSDFFPVKQINVRLGISNEIYVLCVSALTEAVVQFRSFLSQCCLQIYARRGVKDHL